MAFSDLIEKIGASQIDDPGEYSGYFSFCVMNGHSDDDHRNRVSRTIDHRRVLREKSGDVLLSQGHSSQVPSALTGLTSVFGMGTGVTLSLWSPKTLSLKLALRPERARRAP